MAIPGDPPDSSSTDGLELPAVAGDDEGLRQDLPFILNRFRNGDEASVELGVRLALSRGLPLLEIYEALRTEILRFGATAKSRPFGPARAKDPR